METVLVLEAKYLSNLGSVRRMPGLKAAWDMEYIWLKAPNNGPLLASLPVTKHYTLKDNDLLFLPGAKTPVSRLKNLNWQDIKDFIPVSLPVAALPGIVDSAIPVKLKRSAEPRATKALLTTLSYWKAYAGTAPDSRLQYLRFAVSEEGETLVVGQPLPTLPGRAFWAQDNCLLPAGFDFDPPLFGELIREQLPEGTWQLFDTDGTRQTIFLADLQQATRSAVRLTLIANERTH